MAATADPLDYPWPDRFEPGPDVPRHGRTLVLAVGSNASAAVLRRKLAGVDPSVPSAECTVAGLAVGHSAHVSADGYIPAAPFASPGARTPLRAGWFTPQQLAALDRTEPNYDRITLSTARFPLELDVEAFDVYRSRWGILAHEGTAIGFCGQRQLRALLADTPLDARWWADHGHAVPDGLTQ